MVFMCVKTKRRQAARFGVFAMCVLAAGVLLFASCKSTPPKAAGKVPAERPAAVSALRDAALAAQKEALSVKADKAAKEAYGGAVELFNKGEAALKAKKGKEADSGYSGAVELFKEAYKIALDKRVIAELAYKEASEAIMETRRKAMELESQSPGMALDETDGAPE